MEISFIRDHELIANYEVGCKSKRFMILGLSMLDLDQFQSGNIALNQALFNGADDIRQLFSHSFFDLGFSIGTVFMVAMVVMILFQLAPKLGEYLKGKDTANWALGVIAIIGMIIIFLT